MRRRAARLVAPLLACAIAGGAAVAGGACVFPTASNPPKLVSGIYTLTVASGNTPPVVFVDSAGRRLRVIADTFNLNATTQFYDEHAAVAITLPGGSEQPAAPIIIGHQPYTLPSAGIAKFLLTVYGGTITGTILSPTNFQLQLPDHTTWSYDKR
jgi:hypothetical protein